MLPVAEKLAQILLQKPIEIAGPVQPLGMNDHSESWINQEGAAGGSRFRIATVNRDDGFEIAEGLSLQAIKCLSNEISALVDWQSHSDAWRQTTLLLLFCSAGGLNPLRADFRVVRHHGELSWVDRVEAPYGGDAYLEATM